ncbi:MAG: MFS transporter [Rhizobiales bacterium]|nr:MFS transporter [Hyphomicrobiales bacterium]MBO6699960.1 MFS transporter [Hyphomicrobiales bacterium]MBO6737875.1 MFS transporter [Hyphomicrobiales bacterium]MBO6913068.1 MFS transporter [Hyphomicrobiales bacterium]MBO6956656.1 MFS transporter [Hyphomicrobiales bacterium]
MCFRQSKVFLVFLLWFAGLGAAAQFAKIAVPFGLVREAFPEVGNEIGWLLSLISLVGAVLGIVAGDVVGRLGARRVLLFGLSLGAIVSFWQIALVSFGPMLASRLVEGASHLAIVVSAPTLISQLSDKRYIGPAMTLWSTFFGVAFAIVAWVVMPLVASDGFTVLLGGHGVYLAVIAVLVALAVPESRMEAVAKSDANPDIVKAHIRTYTSPRIAAPGAGWLLYTLTFVSLLALLPERLPRDQGIWAAGLMPLVSIAVALVVVPIFLRRHSSVAIIIAGFALASALVLFNVFLNLQLLFAVGLFALLGLVQGASFSAVPELNSEAKDQALAYGFMAQAGNLGNLLGTPLLIFVAGHFGEIGMFLSIAVLYLLGILLHWLLAKTRGAPR